MQKNISGRFYSDFDSSTEFVLQLHQDEIAKLDNRLNKASFQMKKHFSKIQFPKRLEKHIQNHSKLSDQKMLLIKMLYQESNPVPIMSVETSTTDLQEELFDCRRLILKTAIERNMKAAVINQVFYVDQV